MERILVIEDDIALSAGLCFELDAEGYVTEASYHCGKARKLLETDEFALVILDVNLPDGNGAEDYITKPFHTGILLKRNYPTAVTDNAEKNFSLPLIICYCLATQGNTQEHLAE